MEFQLYNIHLAVRTAQYDKCKQTFETYHREMIIALQDALSKNIVETSQSTLLIPQSNFTKKFAPNQSLIDILEEYRGMELGKKKLKKYKFKKADAYFITKSHIRFFGL